MLNSKWVFLYTIFSGLIALCIFLYGYVPVFSPPTNSASYHDVPKTIDGFSIDPKVVYLSHVKKLVLIVVDSLGMKFLTDETKLPKLPHTLRLINTGNVCIVSCNMPPPTTTMKKIKTLATGTTSSFIETILTFSTEELKMDNIFRQAKRNKHLLSLHGAETWTQLFPEYFNRVKTIDVLKMLDHSEVDANVTETFITEMDKDDWNWLVLHYMGLRHSGLDRYSNSKQLAIKLRELDNVIKFAHTKLDAQMNDYMILVVGDTGIENIKDPSESYNNPQTIAPYIVIGKPCPHSRSSKRMNQFDLAPTLAVLTGLPIPASSYGNLNSALLNSLSDDQLLYALHYNTARLINMTSQLNIRYSEDPVYLLFQNAVVQHGKYLQRGNTISYNQLQLRDAISTMYTKTAESLSKRINDFLNTSDVPIQYLAFVLVFQAMIILVNQSDKDQTATKKLNFLVISVTNLLILTWVLETGMSKRGTSFIHMTHVKGLVIASVAVFMLCNSYIMASQRSFLTRLISACTTRSRKSKVEMNTVSSRIELAASKHETISSLMVLLALGTIFHALSLLELSYIKWERSVWFFLWTSICFLIIRNRGGMLYRSDARRSDRDFLSKPQNADEGVISVVFSILIMNRIIMAYTTVGYWLSHGNNHICASICLVFGLMLLAFTCNIYYEPFGFAAEKIITRVLLGLICCFIYMANAARGNVILPYYPKSDGGLETILYWFTWTFIAGYGLGFCTIGTCYKGLSSTKQLMATAITCSACFAALLTHPHKVLLIPIEMLFSQVMSEVFKKHNQSLIISHVWLGHLFFYYQEYTYSLDSVDTATGFLFSKNLSSLIFGVLLVMNTFSAPILSYLICVHGILDNNPKKSTQPYLIGTRVHLTRLILTGMKLTLVFLSSLLYLIVMDNAKGQKNVCATSYRASEGISETNLIFGYCNFLLMSVYLLGMLVHRHNEWFWSILCPKLLYEIAYTFFIATAMIAVQITGIFHDISLKLRISSTESV